MTNLVPYISGMASALCYGSATVLEQIAAKRQKQISSFSLRHLYDLFKQIPYLAGIILDIFGWIFFLITARYLPLFLDLSFVALSLVVSSIIASLFMSVKSSRNEKISMAAVVIGVILLGAIAEPTAAKSVNHLFKIILELFPIPMGIFGLLMLKADKYKFSALILAALSGLTFGATGLISRIINITHFSFAALLQPLTVSLIAYGALGLYFLAASLQRDSVNRINAFLYTFELAVPSALGIFFLGDNVKSGMWLVMLLGFMFVIFGSVITAYETHATSS